MIGTRRSWCQSALLFLTAIFLLVDVSLARCRPSATATRFLVAAVDPAQSMTVLQLRDGGTKASSKVSKSQNVQAASSTKKPPLSKIDVGAFGIYFCTAVTMTLPVLIVPMMDADLQQLHSTTSSIQSTAKQALSLAATVASMAPLGGGFGKLVNGFVCQILGGSRSSKLYFVGSALFSLGLASISLSSSGTTPTTTPTFPSNLLLSQSHVGWMVAGIEFCASIQWTVCSLLLSQFYATQPTLFARGVTILSLASTSGQILSKVIGAFLLQYCLDWRQLALGMCWVATCGFGISTWTSHNMSRAAANSAAVTRPNKAPSTRPATTTNKSLQ